MKNDIIDNSARIEESVLWQYDNALNLIGIVTARAAFARAATESFWDNFAYCIVNLPNASGFGLDFIGAVVGIPRPSLYLDGAGSDDGSEADAPATPMSDALYRKIISATLKLARSRFAHADIVNFLAEISNNEISVTDNYDMSLTFGWDGLTDPELRNIIENSPAKPWDEAEEIAAGDYYKYRRMILPLPAGVFERAGEETPAEFIGLEGQNLPNFAAQRGDRIYDNGGSFDTTTNGGALK